MRRLLIASLILTSAARADDRPPRPAPAEPVTAAELDAAIEKGVAFLLKEQNADGSFGGPEKTKGLNIMASVPGSHHAFQAATTSLALAALLDVGGDASAVKSAVARAEAYLTERLPKLKRASPMELYNVWGHAYAVQALVRMRRERPDDADRRAKIDSLIRLQFDALAAYESVDGGWGYYDFRAGASRPGTDSTSFVNAAVLVAFHEAKAAGLEPPAKVVERAVAATKRQRKGDFTYLYGEYLKYSPLHPINRPAGSLGRSQSCNVALRLWGDDKVTDDVLKTWLDRLIVRNGWLSNGRKRPIPHEAPFAVAGYFYYFGHFYAGLCVKQLPPADQPFYQDHLARLILPLQEPDGSWWDYPLYNYHQPYGTGFALLTLKECRKAK